MIGKKAGLYLTMSETYQARGRRSSKASMTSAKRKQALHTMTMAALATQPDLTVTCTLGACTWHRTGPPLEMLEAQTRHLKMRHKRGRPRVKKRRVRSYDGRIVKDRTDW